MKFATWNLSHINDNYLDGPEATIVERGGSAQSIWTDGSVETGATILGKIEGDITNLERWNVVEVSRTDAEAFIEANFTPFTNDRGFEQTLADALKALD